jgi:hypothetical protein
MAKRITVPLRLSLEQAFRQSFTETAFADMSRRRSSSGKTILGDGAGHEVGETQFINGLWEAVEGTPIADTLSMSRSTNKKGEPVLIVEDPTLLQSVTYSRDEEGTPEYGVA